MCVCVTFVHPNNVQKKHKNWLSQERIARWASETLRPVCTFFSKVHGGCLSGGAGMCFFGL